LNKNTTVQTKIMDHSCKQYASTRKPRTYYIYNKQITVLFFVCASIKYVFTYPRSSIPPPQTLPQISRVHCTIQTVQKFNEEPHRLTA